MNALNKIARSLCIILFCSVGYPTLFIHACNLFLKANITISVQNIAVLLFLFYTGGLIFRYTLALVGVETQIISRKEEEEQQEENEKNDGN